MLAFELTTYDPDEDNLREPTMVPLAEWLAAHRKGEALFEPDVYEGIGLRFFDGSAQYQEECFGDARSMAHNLRAAAARLAEGRLALLRTALLDVGSYVFVVPDGDAVQLVSVSERPPGGDAYPYLPNKQNDGERAIRGVYAWAEAKAAAFLAPTDNPHFDRARGKDLILDRAELVACFRAAAQLSWETAQAIGVCPLPAEGAWTPIGAGHVRPQI